MYIQLLNADTVLCSLAIGGHVPLRILKLPFVLVPLLMQYIVRMSGPVLLQKIAANTPDCYSCISII
jgi:hypothetical protein